MSKITWFLQDIIFSSKEQFKEVKQIIKSFGDKSRQVYDMQTCFSSPNNLRYQFPSIKKDQLYTGFTSIQNIRKLTEHIDFENYPSIGKRYNFLFYGFDEFYNVSRYYNILKQFLLNKDCLFVPAWTLMGDFYEQFYHDYDRILSHTKKHKNGIFVKPDRGDKIFESFVAFGPFDMKMKLNNLRVSKDTILVLSTEKEIMYEYRFYIVGKKISTYSLYVNNTVAIDPKPFKSTFENVEEIIHNIDLDCFTIDVCYWASGSDLCEAVVEINALSTSGIYEHVNLEKLLVDVRKYILKSS